MVVVVHSNVSDVIVSNIFQYTAEKKTLSPVLLSQQTGMNVASMETFSSLKVVVD